MSLIAAPTDVRAERFLRACRREATDVTPIWLMRQAGRSLPAYRALRAQYRFLDLIADAELISEVTLLPFDELDLDAAIMFADIMLPLAALGVEFDIVEAVGPVVAEPIRTRGQVDALARIPIAEAAPMVFEAVRAVRRRLEGVVPLIGFSGAPFTLACYLVDGRASREFATTRALMIGEPATFDALMTRLSDLVIEYLLAQVAAGAQAVQLFDSWIGVLSPPDVERAVLPHTTRIMEAVRATGVPVISFGTNTGSLLELMARAPADVLGIDHRTPLDVAWDRVGHDKAVQGNLEPAVLLATRDAVIERASDVLARAAGRPGHIFNLGHGVLPGSDLDNLKVLVDTVHAWEPRR